MKDNTVLIYAVTLIGIALLSYILWNLDYSESSTEESIIENQFICGNMAFSTPSKTELEQEGEILFKTNCAACHKMYKKATGPALFGSMKKFTPDSIFLTYIRGQKKVLDSLSHNTSGAHPFTDMNYKEASAIKAYINMY